MKVTAKDISVMNPGSVSGNQIVRGTMGFSRDQLKEIDPSYTGYTHLFVLNMPKFMTDFEKLNPTAAMHAKNLKQIIEFGSTSYNGTPDLSLNTSEINIGYGDRAVSVPLLSSYDGNQFSIKCLETRAEPLRKALEYYLIGVSDPIGKYTHLHGVPMDPILENVTMRIMVVQTDQTLKNIQDISLWQSVMPMTVGRDRLNWDQGSVEIVQAQDVQMKGVYFADAMQLLDTAKSLLATRLAYYKTMKEVSL